MRLQFRHFIFIVIGMLTSVSLSIAQVPVSISPLPKLQFLSNSGVPLAAGCLYSYAAGTSNLQVTYTDSTGSVANPDPLILDAGGRGDVWLTSQSYKLVLKSAGGVACASGSQIWSEDNITGFLGLLSLSNIWTNAQTFSQPIIDTATINQLVLGTAPNQTTLNFPAPAGNVSLTFPTTADTMVGRATTDTLTNKTLTSPVLNSPNLNGTIIPGFPATYFSMANDLVTGTTLNKLAKINPAGLAGFAILPLITDTGGIVGIVVAGAGASGSATVQQNGSVSCVFDNATTSGNYIQISPTVAGDCHDAGVTYPNSGQVIGRSLATNVAIGTNIIDLFGPEIKAGQLGATIGCTANTPGTVVNNNTLQTLDTCTIPANTLSAGSLLQVDLIGLESTASGQNTQFVITLGGGTSCITNPTDGVAANQPFNVYAKMGVINAGAGGTANWSCGYASSASGGGVVGPTGTVGTPTIAVNTTISNVLLIQVQMSVANAGNSTTAQVLKAVIF